MDPVTGALIGAGGNVLSSIGGSLLSDSPERNVRRWSGTPSYNFGFMEGFAEGNPYPGITAPPGSSGWQPPPVEQQVGIQHDGNIPISWIKQAYAANRPDKLQDLPRWLRDHGIAENAEYVTPEQFAQMRAEGFSGMSGVSQGAIAAIGADIDSRRRVGQAANQFFAGARGEMTSPGSGTGSALPFAVSDQQGGGSFETVAQTASSLFGKGQGTTPGQLGALPGESVRVPDAPQTPVPPMPAPQQAPPMPQRQPAAAPQQQQAMPPPPPAQPPQVQAQAPTPPSFPGTDPLAMAPQVAQAVQEQIQTDPLQPATENTYVQQLLAALQQDLNTPFVG